MLRPCIDLSQVKRLALALQFAGTGFIIDSILPDRFRIELLFIGAPEKIERQPGQLLLYLFMPRREPRNRNDEYLIKIRLQGFYRGGGEWQEYNV